MVAVHKSRLMRQAEALVKEPLEQYLPRELNLRTRREICEDLQVAGATLNYWLLKLGIHKRWE